MTIKQKLPSPPPTSTFWVFYMHYATCVRQFSPCLPATLFTRVSCRSENLLAFEGKVVFHCCCGLHRPSPCLCPWFLGLLPPWAIGSYAFVNRASGLWEPAFSSQGLMLSSKIAGSCPNRILHRGGNWNAAYIILSWFVSSSTEHKGSNFYKSSGCATTLHCGFDDYFWRIRTSWR